MTFSLVTLTDAETNRPIIISFEIFKIGIVMEIRVPIVGTLVIGTIGEGGGTISFCCKESSEEVRKLAEATKSPTSELH